MTVGESSVHEKKIREVLDVYDLSDGNFKEVLNRLIGPGKKISTPTIHNLPKTHTRFGIIGDLHLNAKSEEGGYGCDFSKFRKVLHIFKEEGAEFVLQTGDVTDGEEMRHHQKYGIVVQGLDNVVEFCVNEWPDCGLPTFFIGGNHDETYLNRIGADVCRYIAEKRPDLHYLGMNEGNLPLQQEYQKMLLKAKDKKEYDNLTKKLMSAGSGVTWIRIRHPSKGSAKGRSYQPQEHIGALEGKFKPHIFIVGHYHKMDYLFKRNVHVYQAGAMEKQSGWMRTKDIQAHLGGIFVDAHYDENGTVFPIYHKRLEYEVNGAETFGILRR
ncbi:MAG TPA: metallophosphoesterase [Candidatus Nanoarchaeia archaeon]|nr:metallophosphoesterase [Candidatus Nanoarchaeia archaeon]